MPNSSRPVRSLRQPLYAGGQQFFRTFFQLTSVHAADIVSIHPEADNRNSFA
jgi:thioesterase domain-containing protein